MMMDINGSLNIHSQPVTMLRNAPTTSDVVEQATRLQQETQSIDQVTTEQPVQKTKAISDDLINSRISEQREQLAVKQVTAESAVGSLIDITV
jgi:hypothetical protein